MKQRNHSIPKSESSDLGPGQVLVCGGGPVGLLLANLLGQADVPCTVVDRSVERPIRSMAIGITPPSLAVLRQVGLDQPFIPRSDRGAFLVGCDGHRSRVRTQAGLAGRSRSYMPRFVMADFEDRSGLGDVARLFFGRCRPVESFPLPGGLRRWIAMVDKREWDADPIELLRTEVRRETGVDLSGMGHSAPSRFRPKRMLAPTSHRGRVMLCGDAAHVMSPIGGQGMNTGFADADLLARALTRIIRHGEAMEPLLQEYTRIRTAAFRIAAGRAARGMWLGTRVGIAGSWFRRLLVQRVLFHHTVRRALPPYVAMIDLPGPSMDPARSMA